MSLYIGKDNGVNLMHLTSGINTYQEVKSPNALPSTLFHSNLDNMVSIKETNTCTVSASTTFSSTAQFLESRDVIGITPTMEASLSNDEVVLVIVHTTSGNVSFTAATSVWDYSYSLGTTFPIPVPVFITGTSHRVDGDVVFTTFNSDLAYRITMRHWIASAADKAMYNSITGVTLHSLHFRTVYAGNTVQDSIFLDGSIDITSSDIKYNNNSIFDYSLLAVDNTSSILPYRHMYSNCPNDSANNIVVTNTDTSQAVTGVVLTESSVACVVNGTTQPLFGSAFLPLKVYQSDSYTVASGAAVSTDFLFSGVDFDLDSYYVITILRASTKTSVRFPSILAKPASASTKFFTILNSTGYLVNSGTGKCAIAMNGSGTWSAPVTIGIFRLKN